MGGELELGVPGGETLDMEAASRAFSFPYPRAYDIQIDLMRDVFRTIEQGKVGLFESPTGTGKSLSLICAAFSWLRLNAQRSTLGSAAPKADDEEPDWVVKHEQDRSRRVKEAQQNELRERIATARRHQVVLKKAARAGQLDQSRPPKRARTTGTGEEDSDDDLLLDDGAGTEAQTAVRMATSYSRKLLETGDKAGADDDSNLSPAVRALMQQYQGTTSRHEEEEEEPETLPRIIYASRTHSQLSQFVAELRKTHFGQSDEETASIRTISLGSRKQMCINDEVQALGRSKGSEAMNERCLELMKASSKSKRCPSLPPFDATGRAQILEFRDNAMAQVTDIEDLVQLGRDHRTCPYFAARSSAKQAELVTLPYNLLLQKDARDSLGISLKACIILIDEAHNLIDTILSTHSVTVSSKQIEQAAVQIQTYLDRFSGRLKGVNEQNLRKLKAFLTAIQTHVTNWGAKRSKDEIVTASDFVRSLSRGLDQVNLITLEAWLKETQIARKVSGYADKQDKKLRAKAQAEALMAAQKGKSGKKGAKPHIVQTSEPNSASPISAMHSIETFLLSLANRTEDGRVLLSRHESAGTTVVQVKYQLLNPSHAFRTLVEESRSVILAGGTMEPLSDFKQQLLPFLTPDRLLTFSCGHVIPPSNLMVSVLPVSPKGLPFEFKYDTRTNMDLLDELGLTLVNLCNVVPDGLVVFLPSYAFLDAVFQRWNTSGTMARLGKKKKVFSEPKTTMEVDKVLGEYSAAISGPSAGCNGSLLFAVVGAKLSEGINFSDKLARAVVMVGMPFANAQSAELAERMKYVRELAQSSPVAIKGDAGNELYTNLCMKAVNQSIGRAVRHQNDYAALILLDRRYARADIRERLPRWIRDQVTVAPRFGATIQQAAVFFKSKRQ